MVRVPLGTAEKLFQRIHRRMLDTGYPTPPWDRLDPSAVDDTALAAARLAWEARTVAEYRSMVVFGEVLARMPEAGLPLEATCAATRLIQDEARHTELCARMAVALGGRGDVPLNPRDLRLISEGLSAKLFVARWVASMFCVGEAASVGLLRALVTHATDPCVTVVARTLLRDEILHDRFGWALARTVFPTLTDDEREWLGADLAFAFAHYDREDAGCMRADGDPLPVCTQPVGSNLGVIPRVHFARAFYQRLDTVILPSLAALGVPAYEAWALRNEAGAVTAATRGVVA